jgi:hypothetical protein
MFKYSVTVPLSSVCLSFIGTQKIVLLLIATWVLQKLENVWNKRKCFYSMMLSVAVIV